MLQTGVLRGLFVQYLFFFFRYLSGGGCLHPTFSSVPDQNDYMGINLCVCETGSVYCLFRAGFLLGLLFDPEYGSDTFLRNFG
jgi:hypothetical protein